MGVDRLVLIAPQGDPRSDEARQGAAHAQEILKNALVYAGVKEFLLAEGEGIRIALSGKDGAKKIQNEDFDIVLTDLRMTDVDGLTLVKKVREHLPDAEVAVITGFNDVRTALEATKLAAVGEQSAGHRRHGPGH